MRIIAAVFIDTIQLREAPGPSTRIDLGGVKFSEVAPGPVPVTVEPHLVVLVHCPLDHKGEGALEDVASTIREVLHPGTLLGTTAVSVLGGDHEVEEQPAITLFAARLGQPVIPVRLDTSTSAGVAISGLSHDLVGDENERTLVLLA